MHWNQISRSGFLLAVVFISPSLYVYSQNPHIAKPRMCCELNLKAGIKKCMHEKSFSELAPTRTPLVWKVPANLMSTNDATKFQLSFEKLKCNGGKGNIITVPTNRPRPPGLSVTFYPSGYLQLSDTSVTADFYHTSQYCINGIGDDKIEVQTCNRKCTETEPCIQKCCPPDQIYSRRLDDNPLRCVDPGSVKWTPRLFKTSNEQLSQEELKKIQPWYSMRQPPFWVRNCKQHTLHFLPFDIKVGQIFGVKDTLQHRIRSDGEIILWNDWSKRWEVFADKAKGNYCLDGILYKNNQVYSHKEEETFMMSCPLKLVTSNSTLLY